MGNIRLRPYTLDDAPSLYAAAKESWPDVYQWLPWCHPEYKLEEAENWLAEKIQKGQKGTEFEFAILDSDGSFLGGCGLNGIDWKNKIANLGYWIRLSAMGQGIAATAVALLAKWGFENTDLIHLEIKCAVGNIRSQRVAEKSGAKKEGIRESSLEIHGKMHDAVVFVIKRDNSEQGATLDTNKRCQ